MGAPPPFATLSHDRLVELLGHGAMEQLRRVVQLVPTHLTDWVRLDPDLASLRSRPDFIELFGAG